MDAVDLMDLTCKERRGPDELLACSDEAIVMLDMSDVCCEVDVGDPVTASNDELKVDITDPAVLVHGLCQGADSTSWKNGDQKKGLVHFVLKNESGSMDSWVNDMIDGYDGYPDSDNESQNDCLSCAFRARREFKHCSTQTDNSHSILSVKYVKDRSDIILFYTGLKSYDRFMEVFNTVEPECYELKYHHEKTETLNTVDQMFLTLMKIRTNKDDLELSFLFGISIGSVANIFQTWMIFLHKVWSQLEFWLPRDVINCHMPTEFRSQFPTVRVIIHCLEVLISKPIDEKVQLATLNLNTNEHTLKMLVGVTPSGSVSFCSEAYGGAISDHEMFELSGILNRLEPNDSIIVDKRFNVEVLCATKDVTVHALNFKEAAGHKLLLTDNCNNQSIFFKNLEHLLKKNLFFSQKLSIDLLPLASEICYVCIMMSNFLET